MLHRRTMILSKASFRVVSKVVKESLLARSHHYRRFLATFRLPYPAFLTYYLLISKICKQIFPNTTSDSWKKKKWGPSGLRQFLQDLCNPGSHSTEVPHRSLLCWLKLMAFQIYRDEQSRWAVAWGCGWEEEAAANGCERSFWEDGNVLKLESGDGSALWKFAKNN